MISCKNLCESLKIRKRKIHNLMELVGGVFNQYRGVERKIAANGRLHNIQTYLATRQRKSGFIATSPVLESRVGVRALVNPKVGSREGALATPEAGSGGGRYMMMYPAKMNLFVGPASLVKWNVNFGFYLAINRALHAKMKLGFIDGTSVKPSANDPDFEQWIRVDSVGNASLSTYFMNSKKLWDEISELKPTPQCTCNGCTCGALKHQLLVMDPLPSINKAYMMVQKLLHVELTDNVENIALHLGQPEGNFAHADDFAGMNSVFASSGANIMASWIVDMGATSHMCANICIINALSPLIHPTLLPIYILYRSPEVIFRLVGTRIGWSRWSFYQLNLELTTKLLEFGFQQLAMNIVSLSKARSSHGLQVSQHKYMNNILADTSMLDAKPAPTPTPFLSSLKLASDDGSLLHDPSNLVFIPTPPGSLDSPHSITGYCVSLGSSLISRKTKKQAIVSRSFAKAEYQSMAGVVPELLSISYVLRDLDVFVPQPIPFWCVNNIALHITTNSAFHERSKHLDINCHLVHDQYKLGFIAPSHVLCFAQLAYLFTKSLPAVDFVRFLSKMGLSFRTIHSIHVV
ncbi:hypothetical protein Sango_2468700 [Sesamum angolense]|uniref:Uncharacterized protein n=1 Tax=Sesamum angolense TaxID=2727404 RepID=A0AAE1W3B2_9LAMI|nr:hypothetical protein Sango_2468700 [Sesamum angolense]